MTDLRVTDHCIVRYIERVLGLDVNAVRLLIRDRCKSAAAVGAKSVTVEGFKYEISRNSDAVITVTPVRPMADNGGKRPNYRGPG